MFRNKKVTILGLGLLGRSKGDAEFLAQCGAHIVVTDKKSGAELTKSVEQLKKYTNITFRLGAHNLEDFTNADFVFKAAGTPLQSPEIAAAKSANVPVIMSTALFAKFVMESGVTVVGVTGTRGKSTVTHMIYHALIQSGKRAHLGGNVRGISTLAMIRDVQKGDIVVLELDSWQLQGFGDLRISPHVAVFTNLLQDHVNYYPTEEAYFADKANIFKFQKPEDVLIVSSTVVERIRMAQPPLDPIVPEELSKHWKLKLLGEHNRENASLAKAALEALGLGEEEIQSGLASFEGVEGRLQFVREVNGIKIYNDNNSTTPEATIAALRALKGDIVLIIGGSDKGLSLDTLISEIKRNVSHVILLTHKNYRGSERCAKEMARAEVQFQEVTDLRDAVELGIKEARGNLLFSPAFASFGMFKNEYDRNDQFMSLVQEL